MIDGTQGSILGSLFFFINYFALNRGGSRIFLRWGGGGRGCGFSKSFRKF